MRIFLLLFSLFVLVSCTQEPQSTKVTPNGIEVDFLFEVDGCRVYRFNDGTREIYLTTCPGQASYRYQSGKTTRHLQSLTVSRP